MLRTTHRIELFGGFNLFRNGELVPSGRASQPVRVLAYLAYHAGREHPRTELIRALWGSCESEDTDEWDRARNRLRVALHGARILLGERDGAPGALRTESGTVWLDSQLVSTDVADFRRLLRSAEGLTGPAAVRCRAEAVELYRGRLLSGFDAPWVATEAPRLEDACRRCLRRLIELMEEGDVHGALHYARRALSLGRPDEQDYLAVLRLALRAGGAAEALAVSDAYEEWLCGAGRYPCEQGIALLRAAQREPAPLPADPLPPPEPAAPPPAVQPRRPAAADSIPVPLLSIMGRDHEISVLREALQSCHFPRLVTVTGPGGIGKTRLAIEAARSLAPHYEGDVAFAALVECLDADAVVLAILRSLRVPPKSDHRLDQLVQAVGDRAVLIILDNCEHLAPVVADLLLLLLQRCPRLTCLATSRRHLSVPGEHELPLEPLPLPADGATLEQERDNPSLRLLEERLQQRRLGFRITERNYPAALAISRMLAGIPLAVEIAASRYRGGALDHLRSSLERGLAVMECPSAGLPARHRSLTSVFEWSAGLLPAEVRKLLFALGVFRGGCSVQAVEAVCRVHAGPMLDVLREHSFLLIEREGREDRYRLLEPIRQYARDRLASEEAARLGRRHALYYDESLRRLREPAAEASAWLAFCEQEDANLLEAVAWSIRHSTATPAPVIYREGLLVYWIQRGRIKGVRAWVLDQGFTGPEAPLRQRDSALLLLGKLAVLAREEETARIELEAALECFRALGDETGQQFTLANLAPAYDSLDDEARRDAATAERLELLLRTGRRADLADNLIRLAWTHWHEGKHDQARRHRELALAHREAITDPDDLARFLMYQGAVEGVLDHPEACAVHFAAARDHMERTARSDAYAKLLRFQADFWNDLGLAARGRPLAGQGLEVALGAELHYEIVCLLDTMTRMAVTLRDWPLAMRCTTAAALLREERGIEQHPHEKRREAPVLASIRTALDEPTRLRLAELTRSEGWEALVRSILAEQQSQLDRSGR